MNFGRLERYVFKKASLNVLVAALGLIGVIWVIRAVQQVDVLMSKGQGIATYLFMTTLGVPTLAAAIAPIALMIGLSQVITKLNHESELVVMHASGASRMTLMRPFLALSLIVAGIIYLLHLWLAPASMALLRTYVTQVRADLVSVIVKEGAFQDIDEGLTFHVAARKPGGALGGVFILDGRSETEALTYMAKRGEISKSEAGTFLVLRAGTIQRLNRKTKAMSTIAFDSYAFNLESFSGGGRQTGVSQLEVPTWNLVFPGEDDVLYKKKPGRYRAELHTRLTGGLYALVVGIVLLAYVGNPISHRQGQFLAFFVACGGVIMWRAISVVLEGGLRTQAFLVWPLWAIPIGLLAIHAYCLATDRNALSERMMARIVGVTDWFGRKLKGVQLWIISLRYGKAIANRISRSRQAAATDQTALAASGIGPSSASGIYTGTATGIGAGIGTGTGMHATEGAR
ncbi:MAG: LptF/LptG family permease [Pseudomonadota bacterium]